jgi:hypothetical protein
MVFQGIYIPEYQLHSSCQKPVHAETKDEYLD